MKAGRKMYSKSTKPERLASRPAKTGLRDAIPLPDTKKPVKIDKPWGYELLFAHTDKYAGKILFVRKGHRLSRQYHQRKDESMYLYSGSARLHLGTATIQIDAGSAIRIAPGDVHRLEALEDSIVIEVSTAQLNDIVRIEDDYGRS